MSSVTKNQGYHDYRAALARVGGASARVCRATFKRFGNGRAHLIWRQVENPHGKFQRMDSDAERQRSLNRARVRVHDRLCALGADRMVTLTYRGNVEDLAASREHLRRWMVGMRKQYPKWKCVACVERQERGALHWHIGVCGWQDVNYSRRLWYGVIGEDEAGQYNIRRPVRRTEQLFYIAKYIGKDMLEDERPRYGHHYVTSRGLDFDVAKIELVDLAVASVCEAAAREFLESRGYVIHSWYRALPSDGHAYGGFRC